MQPKCHLINEKQAVYKIHIKSYRTVEQFFLRIFKGCTLTIHKLMCSHNRM